MIRGYTTCRLVQPDQVLAANYLADKASLLFRDMSSNVELTHLMQAVPPDHQVSAFDITGCGMSE